MFGLSKKELYERRVLISLYALLGDVIEKSEQKLAPTLKELYKYYWSGVLDDGLKAALSPELTALMLAVIFYQDMLNNKASESVILKIQACILENNHDEKFYPPILSKIGFTVCIAKSWVGEEIDLQKFSMALSDISKAIWRQDDSEHLAATINYFFVEAEQKTSIIRRTLAQQGAQADRS